MTSHAITAFLGILFIIITRKIYYRNFELFLCLLIVINFDFFHLLPRIGKYDIYRETVLIVIFFYILETFFIARIFTRKNKYKIKSGHFGKLVLFYLLLIFSGLIIATFKGQPIAMGIKAIKWYPAIFIFFIVLTRKVDTQKFFHYLVLMASFLSILLLIQYAMYNKFHFFFFYDDFVDHIRGIGQIRGLRILEGNSIIVIGCLLSISFFIKSQKLFWLFCSGILLAAIVIVMQVRSQIAAILMTSFFIYFIHNGISTKKIIMGFYLVCSAMVFISILPLFTQLSFISENRLVHTTLRDFEGISRYGGFGHFNIRLLCLENYWALYKENWFIGRGILNMNWPGNIDYYFQQTLHFHLIDLGVFHILVNHGLLGWLFLIALFHTLFPHSLRLNHHPLLASYFIAGIILMPIIDLFFRFDRILLFGIFLALLDQTVSDLKVNTGNRLRQIDSDASVILKPHAYG